MDHFLTDFYLKSNRFSSLEEFFRHPLEYDWELVDQALQEKDGLVLTAPDYDFINFRRISMEGSRSFVMRPIVIIDAMIPYPKADIAVFLDATEEERRKRIVDRDKVWGTQVIRYWELHQLTLGLVKNSNTSFDLVLDAMLPVEQNAEKVMLFLNQKINGIRLVCD